MKDKFNFHASNWIQRINKNNISGTIARYRLQDLQNQLGPQKIFLMTFNTNYINQEQISHMTFSKCYGKMESHF
jgi:hypothetical protein